MIGGGLAGSSLALLVKRLVPGALVAIFEGQERFAPAGTLTARGEATAFLGARLGLEETLARQHLALHGSRGWWAASQAQGLDEMLELGEWSVPSSPAFHIDASGLRTSLLELAASEGITCELGTEVEALQLGRPRSLLRVQGPHGSGEVEARFVVDASGVGLLKPSQRSSSQLQLLTCEARWSGLHSWRAVTTLREHGRQLAFRALAEHNFYGRGWRVRLTPLAGGEHALLVAIDPASAPELAEQFDDLRSLQAHGRFLRSRAGLRELLRGAAVAPESFVAHQLNATHCDSICGPGWCVVGQAAGQLDPFDAAPLRQLEETVSTAADLIALDLASPTALEAADYAARNASFQVAFRQRACRLGRDAYVLHGDPRSLCAALALDLGLELLPLWSQLKHPLQAWLRARLIKLAGIRWRQGLYGRSLPSAAHRAGAASAAWPQLTCGLLGWAALEWASFREHLTPVPGDSYVSASAVLRDYASATRVR